MIEYLACPYHHDNPFIKQERFLQSCIVAAKLIDQGRIIFSPISHSHPISQFTKENNHELWLRQDTPFLWVADRLLVLKLDGWRESRGVAFEVSHFKTNGKPIEWLEPEDYL